VQKIVGADLHRQVKLEMGSQLASGLISLGNTAVSIMIFGQFMTRQFIDSNLFLVGIFLLIIHYSFAMLLLKRIGAK
jgi:hypothetical protein